MSLSVWLKAARLRTLPLAFSCILAGNLLAYHHPGFSVLTWGLAMLTTLLLQILANYANDYGDFMNGADVKGRERSDRMLASGSLSPQQMRKALWLLGSLSFTSGMALLIHALRNASISDFLFFLVLGILSIAAAYFYTAGKKPYGYRALGDLSVFFFFGPVGVAGSYYLQTLHFNPLILMPAVTMGLWAVAVLNLNNMRDRIHDAAAGKITLAVHLGSRGALFYHSCLQVGAVVTLTGFILLSNSSNLAWLNLTPGLAGLFLLTKLRAISQPADFDPYLKPTALLALVNGILMVFL